MYIFNPFSDTAKHSEVRSWGRVDDKSVKEEITLVLQSLNEKWKNIFRPTLSQEESCPKQERMKVKS